MAHFQEPPFNPDDTHPTVTINPIQDDLPRNRGVLGGILLLGALLFTIGAVVVVILPNNRTAPSPDTVSQNPTLTTVPTQTPLMTAPTDIAQIIESSNPMVMPTVSAERISNLLMAPPITLKEGDDGSTLKYDPFTIIPERPRSEFVDYAAESGDTIDGISQRFSLKPETLAWCNDRSIVFVLRPGDVVKIPPVDGACHVVLGTRQETIATVAEQYKVTAQALINSPYSNFYNMSPDDVLPGGTNIFIPNGQGELITWNPPSKVEKDANGNIRSVSFANGLAGSCGAVDPGGGAAWGNPLPNGTWVRGFSVGHTGIDLSAPVGTPIYAANSGPVLFSGFNNWGYGNLVVLGHGAISTLYGHMSQINATCGQYINVGGIVGLVGSTGNSTGPHLHFEIRFNDVPTNPSGTPGIGW